MLRFAFGVNIAGHGFVRLTKGLVAFADQMAAGFDHTAMPTAVVRLFGLTLPPIELTIGVLIMFGVLLRPTLVAGGLLMAALMFGTTLQQKWDVLGVQLLYSLTYYVLLVRADDDRLSIDRLRRSARGR